MLNQIIVKPAPVTTMSIDATVYMGQSQIRRNTGAYTVLYQGSDVVTRAITLASGASFSNNESIIGLFLRTDTPLLVTVNSTIMEVNQLLMLDSPISNLVLVNNAANIANLNLTYLTV